MVEKGDKPESKKEKLKRVCKMIERETGIKEGLLKRIAKGKLINGDIAAIQKVEKLSESHEDQKLIRSVLKLIRKKVADSLSGKNDRLKTRKKSKSTAGNEVVRPAKRKSGTGKVPRRGSAIQRAGGNKEPVEKKRRVSGKVALAFGALSVIGATAVSIAVASMGQSNDKTVAASSDSPESKGDGGAAIDMSNAGAISSYDEGEPEPIPPAESTSQTMTRSKIEPPADEPAPKADPDVLLPVDLDALFVELKPEVEAFKKEWNSSMLANFKDGEQHKGRNKREDLENALAELVETAPKSTANERQRLMYKLVLLAMPSEAFPCNEEDKETKKKEETRDKFYFYSRAVVVQLFEQVRKDDIELCRPFLQQMSEALIWNTEAFLAKPTQDDLGKIGDRWVQEKLRTMSAEINTLILLETAYAKAEGAGQPIELPPFVTSPAKGEAEEEKAQSDNPLWDYLKATLRRLKKTIKLKLSKEAGDKILEKPREMKPDSSVCSWVAANMVSAKSAKK